MAQHRPTAMAAHNPPRVLSEPRCVWPAAAELGEGACWSSREQALYWVDILGQRLHRYTPADRGQDSWDLGDMVSAVAERRAAPGLLVSLRRSLGFFYPTVGTLQRMHEVEPDRPGNRFNDGKCDAAGRFWGGSMDMDCRAPTGALYRFDGEGNCTRALDAGFAVTNGPTWSLDGCTMFFNDTVRREVNAFDFDPAHGALGPGRVWLRFAPDEGFPDGMCTDAEGRLWIAHWGGARVSCRDPHDARELARIELPTSHITNVAFGGPNFKTLYITSARSGLDAAQLAAQPLAGALFAVECDVNGMPAHLFNG